MLEQSQTTTAESLPLVVVISLAERREKCAWCWEKMYPGTPYPENWSSTICLDCVADMYAQHARRHRATRKEAR
jgi:hypothetical protein